MRNSLTEAVTFARNVSGVTNKEICVNANKNPPRHGRLLVMQSILNAIDWFNAQYGIVLVILLSAAGIYFGVYTLLVQIRYVPDMFKAVVERPSELPDGKQGISAFKALL